MQTSELEPLLTIDQMAAMLAVSRRQVYLLMEIGMPHVRVGKRIRFVRDDVMEWLRTALDEDAA